MSRLREHTGLAIILAAFLALGTLYLRVTPLLETPDEPSHFSVAKYIADEARLPPARPAPPDAGPVPIILPGPPVYYAPPLYYILGALIIADLDTDGFAAGVIPNPNWARGWAPTPGRSPENKHIYVHTVAQRFPPPTGASWAAAMIRLRVFSLLLGGATVGGVYALARTLWPRPTDQSWVMVATALVAFNPAFLFVTIGVTNDALLIALITWAFVLMASLLRNPRRRPVGAVTAGPSGFPIRVALLGVALGLAALTKQSALAFFPLAALTVILSARSGPQPRRTALKWLLLWASLVALLAGWWYLHNSLTYGDPLGFQPHQTPIGEWKPPLSLLVRQLARALQGYWGAFGWGLILVDPIIYVIIAAFVLTSLLGWLRRPRKRAAQRGDEGRKTDDKGRVVAILTFGVSLNLIGLVLWLWRTSAPYGRLLFPTLGPLAVLLASGWRHWLGRPAAAAFAWAVALVMGLYAAVVPWRYLQPAYAHPVVSSSALEDATALDVQFDQIIHLLGYRMTPETTRPSDRVTLVLYWQAMAPVGQDATVFVQLAPGNPEQRVDGLDDYLGSSRYPSGVWQMDEVIEQVHQLRLPDDAPAPALYWFTVGLYSEPGSERWPGTADSVPLPDRAVRLGPLRVLSEKARQPRQQVDYRLGSAIRLSGYDVDLTQPGFVTVTLYWEAEAAPGQNLTAFVHLLDADGHLVAQHDGSPRQGDYPTWAWQPGDQVPDPHTLVLPPDPSPGTYYVQVGLYRPEDGTRIPIFDSANRPVPDDVLPLTELTLSDENG